MSTDTPTDAAMPLDGPFGEHYKRTAPKTEPLDVLQSVIARESEPDVMDDTLEEIAAIAATARQLSSDEPASLAFARIEATANTARRFNKAVAAMRIGSK